MSKEDKLNVDTDGLTKFARNSLVIMGLLMMFSYIALDFFDIQDFYNYPSFMISVGGVVYMIWGAQKFDHNS